jgi:hypothetical protein
MTRKKKVAAGCAAGVILAALGLLVASGAVGSNPAAVAAKPPVVLSIVPVVTQWNDDGHRVAVAVEFANHGLEPLTFITPQDGSEWGWLDPKYLYKVTPEGQDPLGIFMRCGLFGGRYDKTTLFTVPPGESRFILTRNLPYRLPAKGRVAMSLTYEVSPKPTPGRGNTLDKWPEGMFIGSLRSDEIGFDPSQAEPPPLEDIGQAHLKDMPKAGTVESGMELTLYPARKVQAWEDPFMWLAVVNKADTDLVTGNHWRVEMNWTDAGGKPVPHFEYTGDNTYYRGDLPAKRPAGGLNNTQIPIGFQKKPGKYMVSCTLIVEGRGQATSNAVEVEIVPNKLAAN